MVVETATGVPWDQLDGDTLAAHLVSWQGHWTDEALTTFVTGRSRTGTGVHTVSACRAGCGDTVTTRVSRRRPGSLARAPGGWHAGAVDGQAEPAEHAEHA